jgi:hypothetical protein
MGAVEGAGRTVRPSNPPTRVGNVVIFSNGQWRMLTRGEQSALDKGKPLVIPTPPYFPWREIVYK